MAKHTIKKAAEASFSQRVRKVKDISTESRGMFKVKFADGKKAAARLFQESEQDLAETAEKARHKLQKKRVKINGKRHRIIAQTKATAMQGRIVFQKFLRGTDFQQLSEKGKLTEQDCRQAAKALEKMHEAKAGNPVKIRQELVQQAIQRIIQLQKNRLLTAEQARKAKAFFARVPEFTPGITHTDLWLGNFFREHNGNVRLVDDEALRVTAQEQGFAKLASKKQGPRILAHYPKDKPYKSYLKNRKYWDASYYLRKTANELRKKDIGKASAFRDLLLAAIGD